MLALRRIIDAIPEAIIVLGPDGITVGANAFMLDFTGMTLDEMTADVSRVRRFHPDDVDLEWAGYTCRLTGDGSDALGIFYDWSLTSLQQRLLKTGGRLIRHPRYFILQLAESHLTPTLFRQILARIERLAWHPT